MSGDSQKLLELADRCEKAAMAAIRMENIVKLHPRDHKALVQAPQPNEALRRLLRNESVLDRVRGIAAQPGTSQTDADPRNPALGQD